MALSEEGGWGIEEDSGRGGDTYLLLIFFVAYNANFKIEKQRQRQRHSHYPRISPEIEGVLFRFSLFFDIWDGKDSWVWE